MDELPVSTRILPLRQQFALHIADIKIRAGTIRRNEMRLENGGLSKSTEKLLREEIAHWERQQEQSEEALWNLIQKYHPVVRRTRVSELPTSETPIGVSDGNHAIRHCLVQDLGPGECSAPVCSCPIASEPVNHSTKITDCAEP